MRRKHYIIIANALNKSCKLINNGVADEGQKILFDTIVTDLEIALKLENDNFDVARFEEVVYGETKILKIKDEDETEELAGHNVIVNRS